MKQAMKQALLILSGNESEKLPSLVKQFDERFNIYIHIDKKMEVSDNIILSLKRFINVKMISRLFITNWGSMNIVNAILHLCTEALYDNENSHFHLISGADYPIKSNDYIFKTFNSEEDNYINYFRLPTPYWEGGGYNRLLLFHPLDSLNIKNLQERDKYIKFVQYQIHNNIEREPLNIPYYGGSTWWSLSRGCIEYIVKNKDAYNLYQRMHDTFAPDEMFVQTLLANSPYRPYLKNNNLRFIKWEYQNGNIPANLDLSDLNNIIGSNNLFMRKVDKACSIDLVKEIASRRNP